MRLAVDGKAYGIQDFAEYYKDDWQAIWGQAPVLLCKQCRAVHWAFAWDGLETLRGLWRSLQTQGDHGRPWEIAV